ncbi:ComF family protein [Roseivirga misakiensis]|uniref:ComF family protein n=1 Tax=Roseivirga misakiensis TaxID=1563681 RepID=UPI00114D219E|nr:phosphoribosyltransferase family protein [Roseivirga misakiensis]
MQKILKALKYGDQPGIGEELGSRYGNELALAGFEGEFDIIVPVPIHHKRLQTRGYNQSEYFAMGLSKALSVPMNTSEFVKKKHIDSLTKQSKINRIASVDDVFSVIDGHSFEGKRILLVDDVVTTGSTLIACIESLEKANPKAISIATIGGLK